jgi:flagellar protein FlgJ
MTTPAIGAGNASALARLNSVHSAPQQKLAASGGGLDALRLAAKTDPKAAIKEAAKQFEALFMQELMKSMRATTMKSDMLDNNATEMVGGMLDQQYSQQLTGLPGGLADSISRQLERQLGITPTAASTSGAPTFKSLSGAASTLDTSTGAKGVGAAPARALQMPARPAAAALAPAAAAGAAGTNAVAKAGTRTDTSPTQRAQDFLETHRSAASAASQGSGIPADFMLAQAAHETGWGKREIRNSDGSSANNLFGIKATGDWHGPVAVATTTEVIDGVAHKVQARFRSYATPEASFKDYAGLISTSPRYSDVMEAGADAKGFAQGLQRAGYATDPDYAAKLGRVINTTLRLQKLST